MAIQKNIGKNTIGDNNKMSVSLHDYNMSTHDLSTIVRNTQSPGTLVPNLCLVAQKGDTFDVDIDSKLLRKHTGRKFLYDWNISKTNNNNKRNRYNKPRQYNNYRRSNNRR